MHTSLWGKSMDATTTIHVLAFGEGFRMIFNVIAMFVSGGLFLSLLKIAALLGIVMTTAAWLKGRDPMVYARWLFAYTLITGLILTPKATVTIDDITANKPYVVANVPWVIATTASLFTNIGYALTQKYESLLTRPGSDFPQTLTYSKTGMLFGAKLLEASHSFHIVNPDLKEDMNTFFRNCVVGDIAINRKYSVADIKRSDNIRNLTMDQASKVRRMVMSNGENVSCYEAVNNQTFGLKKRLDEEVKNAYTFFGRALFSRPAEGTTYETLMESHLKDAYGYYQNVTDGSANLVLQNMMINAVKSGLADYSAKTNSSAAILNNQFSKTQLQHRAAWNIGAEKAIWFLPLLHTILLMMMFAVFPLILIFSTVTGGAKILKSYFVFLFSLELWPMLFSILNAAMVMYGSSKTSQFGAVASIDLDSLDQVHRDLASVAGFLMMSIPFLAKGLVSNIGEAFAGLATSLTSHMQSASMQAASEVANASYSLGNNSFYNTTANTLSANKHDVNYTDFAGQRTVQALSGATITDAGDGEAVYNSQPAISNSAIGVVSTKGLQDSLSHAKERADQSVFSKASSFNDSVSQAGHKAYQFNDAKAHDMRLGEGASSSESFQAQQALSHAWSMAEDVAKRNGVSTEEAFSGMARHTYSAQAGFDLGKVLGKIPVIKHAGISAGGSTSHGIENTHSGTNRNTASTDYGLSAREEEAFRNDLSAIESYTRSHHFDSSGTESENLLYQVGTDLRQASSFSESLNASLSQSERISDAQNYVSTHSDQLNHNLNQEAVHWAVENYGQEKMNYLETHPADPGAQTELEHIKQEFLDSKASSLIHASELSSISPGQHYDRNSEDMNVHKNALGAEFNQQAKLLKGQASAKNLGVDQVQKQAVVETTGRAVDAQRQTLNLAGKNKAQNVSQTVKTPVKKYSDKPERQ